MVINPTEERNELKTLTIVPSIYPEKLDKMLDSYHRTVCDSCVVITSKPGVTKAINEIFEKYPHFDYYFLANDDMEFLTKDWDITLVNKGKISYGDDGFQGANLPTFPMIDGDIARAVGWLQLPTLNRYAGDVVWKFIGEQLNILNYVPEVKLKHHWEGADPVINKEDMAEFAKWLPYSHKDIERIKGVLCQKVTQ